MPRTVTIPEQLYPAGSYTQTLDSFNPNTNDIIVTLTRVAWPGVPGDNVARLSIQWSDGSGAAWELPGGVVLGRDGLPLLANTLIVTVPQANVGGSPQRKAVSSGLVTFLVRQALTTAITAEARQ